MGIALSEFISQESLDSVADDTANGIGIAGDDAVVDDGGNVVDDPTVDDSAADETIVDDAVVDDSGYAVDDPIFDDGVTDETIAGDVVVDDWIYVGDDIGDAVEEDGLDGTFISDPVDWTIDFSFEDVSALGAPVLIDSMPTDGGLIDEGFFDLGDLPADSGDPVEAEEADYQTDSLELPMICICYAIDSIV